MNKIFFSKHRIIIIMLTFLILIIMSALQMYNAFFRYHITAKFVTSSPLNKYTPVYYRGCRIGEIEKVSLSNDYQHTTVKIMLYPRNPKLPANITARIKKQNPKKDYLELADSDEATDKQLQNGDTIEGEPPFDIESFIIQMMDSGMLNPIIDNVASFIESITYTSDKMGAFFDNSNTVLKTNEHNINQTAKSFKEVSSKLNNSISEKEIKNTAENINKASNNVLTTTEKAKNISENIENATKDMDKTSLKIDKIITDTCITSSNARIISTELRRTLMQRLGMFRLLFGKPIKKNECSSNSCN